MRFRELTRFDGVLRPGAAGMEVHLVSSRKLTNYRGRPASAPLSHTNPTPNARLLGVRLKFYEDIILDILHKCIRYNLP